MSVATRVLLGLALGVTGLAAAGSAQAQTFKTLYKFRGGADGAAPAGGLVLRNGALYGTTSGGRYDGTCIKFGCGTVFKFDLSTATLTTLHTFTGGADGATPEAGVVFDAAGMLYGTTSEGGTTGAGATGYGTVYRLDPATQTLTVLHAFSGGADGNTPLSALVFNNGMLYGTTRGEGGSPNGGTVFALNPATQSLTTLYTFCSLAQCADGLEPSDAVVFDAAGMLYGTTHGGGPEGAGTLFELNPATHALATLYSFDNGPSGTIPGSLLLKNDILYGTTLEGRTGPGTVFRFNLSTERFRTLHFFSGGANGGYPNEELAADPTPGSGAIYGATENYNTNVNLGTIFKLKSGAGTLTTLHAFTGPDGASPLGGVILDTTTGALYGTTSGGGSYRRLCGKPHVGGCGTLFKLRP